MDGSAKLQKRFYHVFSCPNTLRGEKYFEQIMKEKSNDLVVLDFSCYSGGLCHQLTEFGASRIVGIDISETGISKDQKNFGHFAEFYCMDGHKTSFRESTFDFVVGRAIPP